ncbi:MAG: long-chain-acyl-CoA synthetase [Steroidobacteraceae bacterium]
MPPADADTQFARAAWVRALQRTADIESHPDVTMPVLIERLAQQFGGAPALVSNEVTMSYRQLSDRCNQYSRWGLAQGLKPGDVVSSIMENCVEYLAVWLGLSRLGVAVALANTHLTGQQLTQSINLVAPKLLIVGGSVAPAVATIHSGIATQPTVWAYGPSQDFAALQPELQRFSGGTIGPSECAVPSLHDTALYIYTSGTTGLPKAARVSHYRILQWSQWFAGLMDTGPHDRMYDCLPLYHSVGGVVATGATLVGGGAVVIRARFSAADFWRDVRDERCTLFQYIGELCRYLVNSPRQTSEAEHGLRLACGNGLRPDVWEEFRTRFCVPRILEYYASTEGNFSLYNCEGEPGSIGRIPAFLTHRLPVALLRFDVDTGAPWRNSAGFCERCATNEVGEAVGLIPDTATSRVGCFEGYSDDNASAAKVLRNVFVAGDCWYRTGDLMRRDERGFYYFVDRVGDTYRWKGENVSTTDVLSALTAARGVREGVVFGVAIPGADGRAGLAALVVDSAFDLAAFHAHVGQCLPSYARPVFLRLLRSLDTTGTFKARKQDLLRAGFDPRATTDPLFFDDAREGSYVPLDTALYAAIQAGRIRF